MSTPSTPRPRARPRQVEDPPSCYGRLRPDEWRALNGFTLVELLVVITIIVVLLSLLAPAMDRAIYQAELVTCGATQKTLATGATVYATAFNRHYPQRPVNGTYIAPMIDNQFDNQYDMRIATEGYIPVKAFADPMSPDIDLSVHTTDEAPATEANLVCSSYDPRFDWSFAGGSSMKKIGKRWDWVDDRSGPARTLNSSVLVGDRDRIFRNAAYLGSHPDSEGLAVEFYDGHNGEASYKSDWYIARWQSASARVRGTVDMNFTYEDGSCVRIDSMKVNDPLNASTADERLFRVPEYGTAGENAGWEAEWVNVPAT